MSSTAHTPGRRAAIVAAVASFLLHALALLVAWQSWTPLGRRNVVTWIDFPISLLYLGRPPRELIVWSLIAGGAQWALIGAFVALLLGSSARKPARS
jgi:hypothetical protein